eukprot:1016573-Prorocentrum_minimum.AAC.1
MGGDSRCAADAIVDAPTLHHIDVEVSLRIEKRSGWGTTRKRLVGDKAGRTLFTAVQTSGVPMILLCLLKPNVCVRVCGRRPTSSPRSISLTVSGDPRPTCGWRSSRILPP